MKRFNLSFIQIFLALSWLADFGCKEILQPLHQQQQLLQKRIDSNSYDYLYLEEPTFKRSFLEHRTIHAMPNIYYKFFHGAVGTFAYQTFFYDLSTVKPLISPFVEAYVLDCFCSGDLYFVWVNGTILPLPSSIVYDPGSEPCQLHKDNYVDCDFFNQFSKLDYFFLTGNYVNITIQVASSPFRSGAGYFILYTFPLQN